MRPLLPKDVNVLADQESQGLRDNNKRLVRSVDFVNNFYSVGTDFSLYMLQSMLACGAILVERAICTVKRILVLQIGLNLNGLLSASEDVMISFDLLWIWTGVLLQFAGGVDRRIGSLTQAKFFLILILAQFVDRRIVFSTQARF